MPMQTACQVKSVLIQLVSRVFGLPIWNPLLTRSRKHSNIVVERLPLAWADATLTWWTRLQQLTEQQTLLDREECYHTVCATAGATETASLKRAGLHLFFFPYSLTLNTRQRRTEGGKLFCGPQTHKSEQSKRLHNRQKSCSSRNFKKKLIGVKWRW